MNADATKPPICLSGHLDTVHPKGLFGTPAVKFDGDKIYGPGIADCKGGIVAALLAMAALDKENFTVFHISFAEVFIAAEIEIFTVICHTL